MVGEKLVRGDFSAWSCNFEFFIQSDSKSNSELSEAKAKIEHLQQQLSAAKDLESKHQKLVSENERTEEEIENVIKFLHFIFILNYKFRLGVFKKNKKNNLVPPPIE